MRLLCVRLTFNLLNGCCIFDVSLAGWSTAMAWKLSLERLFFKIRNLSFHTPVKTHF